MRWEGHLARVGERRGLYRVLEENVSERYHLKDPDIDGRILLRWVFRKWDVVVWTGSSWLRIGRGSGHL
jgi:hypothetical protein